MTQTPLALTLGMFLALAAQPSAAAGGVLTVDDDGPADHATIQAAIDAAGPTDTIVVRPGSYGPFAIDGKTVRMIADGTGVAVSGKSTILSIAADEACVLVGFDIVSVDEPALTLASCVGPVWIESCSIESSGVPLFLPTVGMTISTCNSVVLSDCAVAAGAVPFGLGGAGDVGLSVVNSTLHVYDSTVNGGLAFFGANGAVGLRATNSTIFASGSSIVGGPGGDGEPGTSPFDPCTNGGDGGIGLQLQSPPNTVTLLDTTVAGGPGGAAGDANCSPGAPGPATVAAAGSTVATLATTWPARHYDIPSPIRSGDPGVLSFTATPGELAWAVFSLDTAPAYIPVFSGSLALGGQVIFYYAGQVPAGGTLSLPINVNLPPGVPYALAYEQGLFFSLEDEFVLGTPRAGWILAAGL